MKSTAPKVSVVRWFQVNSGWSEPGVELGPADPGEPQFAL